LAAKKPDGKNTKKHVVIYLQGNLYDDVTKMSYFSNV